MTRKTLRLLDLPWDVVVEILSRVPGTSLSRLLFTCKRLNALFKDQDFIKKHLDNTAKQCTVFMLSDLKVYSMNVDHDNVVAPQKLLSLNDFHKSEKVEIYRISHCNGLLLCTTLDFKRRRLVVWNPCTGQIRWIPQSDHHKANYEFALGYKYNKSCQVYKILRCSWDVGDPIYRAGEYGIYDFVSHSWRVFNDVIPKNCSIISKGVSLKGNAYWIAFDKRYQGNILIISFNFSIEKWLSIPFPHFGADCVPTALSVVREERLAVLYSSIFNTRKIEIWMMTLDDKIDQTKVLSCSKFLSLELDKNIPLKRFLSDTTFFVDEEKKAAVLCDLEYRNTWNRDMVYIVGENNWFMEIPVGKYRRPLIYNYVPSLVQIQQGRVMIEGRKRKKRH